MTIDKPESWPGLVALLSDAADAMRDRDVAPYVKLRAFVRSGMTGDRADFERRFSAYRDLVRDEMTYRLKVVSSLTNPAPMSGPIHANTSPMTPISPIQP